MDDHLADVRRYDPTADAEAIERIVKHLGVALKNPQSLHIKALDARQIARLRDKWCGKKLGCTDRERAELAIEMADLAMGTQGERKRVTFYFLVAKQLGRLDAL
ncbi:DUF2853 family protein [Mesorhizobium sp. YIM 152430]|uniref:DUF2853 family protein n=1 Tax=Mesorhizobium sp. YIM 152430 TaxID=3031761 RepID=UPI0023DBE37A|nr:DUF2853 family protein [Mesorhizobium sp. YIM 152430]MDF1598330.1 DUF2853 family protein [Mesorhizobium sp. YIM 152430]